jgi:hypothetical protein
MRALAAPDRDASHAHQSSLVETPSMFKQVVPVLSLILLAGPVFAADTTPSTDQSAAAPAAKSTKKHHAKKHHKAATSTDASAPK